MKVYDQIVAGLIIGGAILLGVGTACTKQQGTVVKDVGVKVGEDVCKEVVEATGEPDWMTLACTTTSGIVKVLLPRTEGRAILARKAGVVDAGPGK